MKFIALENEAPYGKSNLHMNFGILYVDDILAYSLLSVHVVPNR